MTGRGLLGKWGPNHAADPVVTRWKRDENGNIILDSKDKPILQFVAIQRADTKEWAIPGVIHELKIKIVKNKIFILRECAIQANRFH